MLGFIHFGTIENLMNILSYYIEKELDPSTATFINIDPIENYELLFDAKGNSHYIHGGWSE